MLISRTPYRFSLYGGGLDYQAGIKKIILGYYVQALIIIVTKALENYHHSLIIITGFATQI